MKTIVHLIDTTGPGGAETVFTDLIRGLPADLFRSIPVITGPGWVRDTLSAAGTPPVVIDGKQRLRQLSEIVATIRREKAVIVHAHLIGSSLYGSVAARLCGQRAVCTFHGPADLPEGDRYRAARFGVIGAAASHITFVSESLREWVIERTPLPERKTSVVYNGVDMSRYESAAPSTIRSELSIPENTLLLGALGNVRAPKGYEFLLEALALIPPEAPDWHFVIIGDTSGDVFPRVRAIQHDLGLDERVSFAGFREDVPAVLRSLDVFVLSSLTEGFSLATVQALASGLPVIATRCGGPEEILTGDGTGLLVPPADPRSMADAITLLLSDALLRERLARAGRHAVQTRFSMSAMVDAYAQIYDRLS